MPLYKRSQSAPSPLPPCEHIERSGLGTRKPHHTPNLWAPESWTSASRTVRNKSLLPLSHPVYESLWRQPSRANKLMWPRNTLSYRQPTRTHNTLKFPSQAPKCKYRASFSGYPSALCPPCQNFHKSTKELYVVGLFHFGQCFCLWVPSRMWIITYF